MQPFRVGRNEVRFECTTGRVVGVSQHSKTYVSSHTPVSIPGATNQNLTPSVRSSVVTTHEFWVQKATGVEVPVRIVNKSIPLHDGQQVTAVSGYKNGADSGYWSLLVNHTAQRYWFMLEANEFRDRFRLTTGYWPFTVAFLLLPVACIFFYIQLANIATRGGYWMERFVLGLYALAMLVWLIALITKIMLNRNLDRWIAAHLDQLGKELLTQPPAD